MYYILVLDEPRFNRVLRKVVSNVRRYLIRRNLRDLRSMRLDRFAKLVNDELRYSLGELFYYDLDEMDGILFEYNKRWIEILKDGHGDYPTFFDFLEEEFGSIENWLRDHVFRGSRDVQREG